MSSILARLSSFAWVLSPISPPPHFLSTLSLNCALQLAVRVLNAAVSSALTPVRQTTEQVFLCVSVPSLLLPLTMANGTPILRHSAGIHSTSSIGSTSWGITTSFAFFCSTKVVTCFKPYLRVAGGALLAAFSPAAAAAASVSSLPVLAALVSGWYFTSILNSSEAWFLSNVRVNWLMEGGTLRRCSRIFFWRWMRTYLGHLT
mmetsp:Transcript_23204/g.51539  ORF Transcript_23204/g.51539 Transcript_23204/m.51539 type:complete len:203 (-) Transcript_23204:220-828(-)